MYNYEKAITFINLDGLHAVHFYSFKSYFWNFR